MTSHLTEDDLILHFYGERFNTVEINNTFYRMPKTSVVGAWADEVPANFQFVLKASQRITHFQRLKDCAETLGYLVDHLRSLGATSVRVAVLLRKQGRQNVPLQPDYFGFDIPDAFVVGYGLDYNDEYRQLPYVAVLPASEIRPTAIG